MKLCSLVAVLTLCAPALTGAQGLDILGSYTGRGTDVALRLVVEESPGGGYTSRIQSREQPPLVLELPRSPDGTYRTVQGGDELVSTPLLAACELSRAGEGHVFEKLSGGVEDEAGVYGLTLTIAHAAGGLRFIAESWVASESLPAPRQSASTFLLSTSDGEKLRFVFSPGACDLGTPERPGTASAA